MGTKACNFVGSWLIADKSKQYYPYTTTYKNSFSVEVDVQMSKTKPTIWMRRRIDKDSFSIQPEKIGYDRP